LSSEIFDCNDVVCGLEGIILKLFVIVVQSEWFLTALKITTGEALTLDGKAIWKLINEIRDLYSFAGFST
jgi:hypothetical protein